MSLGAPIPIFGVGAPLPLWTTLDLQQNCLSAFFKHDGIGMRFGGPKAAVGRQVHEPTVTVHSIEISVECIASRSSDLRVVQGVSWCIDSVFLGRSAASLVVFQNSGLEALCIYCYDLTKQRKQLFLTALRLKSQHASGQRIGSPWDALPSLQTQHGCIAPDASAQDLLTP
jgi:hypothetical protein